MEIAAVILLLVGGFFFLVGWIVGCVLLWASPRWRWTDKLLATLVWPGGFVAIAPLAAVAGLPPGESLILVFIVLLSQIAVAVRLLRRASRERYSA